MKKQRYLFLLILLALIFTSCELFYNFTFTRNPKNLLLVIESDYDMSNDYPMVDMVFPTPASIGATKYTLQQYDSVDEVWENFQYFGSDVETSSTISDNFSLNLGNDGKIRLLITGGDYDGQTSNEVYVELSSIDTYFQGWAISASSTILGYDTNNVGDTIEASFVVKKNLPDNTVINNALTYQWYRVDPDNFENITLISGATSNEYTTTSADKGYFILIKASGDNISAGGYCQLLGPYIK